MIQVSARKPKKNNHGGGTAAAAGILSSENSKKMKKSSDKKKRKNKIKKKKKKYDGTTGRLDEGGRFECGRWPTLSFCRVGQSPTSLSFIFSPPFKIVYVFIFIL